MEQRGMTKEVEIRRIWVLGGRKVGMTLREPIPRPVNAGEPLLGKLDLEDLASAFSADPQMNDDKDNEPHERNDCEPEEPSLIPPERGSRTRCRENEGDQPQIGDEIPGFGEAIASRGETVTLLPVEDRPLPRLDGRDHFGRFHTCQ